MFLQGRWAMRAHFLFALYGKRLLSAQRQARDRGIESRRDPQFHPFFLEN